MTPFLLLSFWKRISPSCCYFYPNTPHPLPLSFLFPFLFFVFSIFCCCCFLLCWVQSHIDDQKANLMASSSTARVMEKPGQEQLQQQQQALKCPRCDSSNTKFCYYNNYSLSQPRHFCKACKRYWTRGGTLRNVPVGGGCRKNKRVKRPPSSSSSASAVDGSASSSSSSAPSSNLSLNPTSQQTQIDLSSHISPLFYGGLSSNPCDHMSHPFPSRFSCGSVSSVDAVNSGYDHLQPQLSALGQGFSSGIMSNGVDHCDYRNGFNPTTKQIQDIFSASNASLISGNYSIFSSSTTTASPTMASLLASKFSTNGGGGLKDASGGTPNHFQNNLAPLEDLHIAGEAGNMVSMKEVKLQEEQSRLQVWNMNAANCQNQTDQIGHGFSDPSLYWSATAIASTNWHDPANIGSSVPSLI